MKSLVLVAAAATALLGACAVAPTASNVATASAGDTTNAYGREVDQRRVNAINNVARVNGVEVHWINYPEVRATSGSAPAVADPTGT